MKQNTDGYFLCVPCAGGYYSFYNDFYNSDTAKRVYIIKGAADLCAHFILKELVKNAEKAEIATEKIYNVHSPDMLEALSLPEKGIYIINGGYPHAAESKYPIAVETVINADIFFNKEILIKNATAVKITSRLLEETQRRSINYLSAIKSVCSDSYSLLSTAVDRKKIQRYVQRFSAREFPSEKASPSKADIRFLSAATPNGIHTNYGSLNKCKRIITIDDSVGYTAGIIIDCIKKEAEKRGLKCTVCMCQTRPDERAEHIIIPEADIAFFTANKYHPSPDNTERTIHITRFLDRDKTENFRFRLSFNKKAEKELIKEVIKAEACAKELRDILNSYYAEALNTDKLKKYTETLSREIFGEKN